eukprot:scaffold685_cov281-Pinguiococcus_pyrenoidosus.AAC.2
MKSFTLRFCPLCTCGLLGIQVREDVRNVADDHGRDRHPDDEPEQHVDGFANVRRDDVPEDNDQQRRRRPVDGPKVALRDATAIDGKMTQLDLELHPGLVPGRTCPKRGEHCHPKDRACSNVVATYVNVPEARKHVQSAGRPVRNHPHAEEKAEELDKTRRHGGVLKQSFQVLPALACAWNPQELWHSQEGDRKPPTPGAHSERQYLQRNARNRSEVESILSKVVPYGDLIEVELPFVEEGEVEEDRDVLKSNAIGDVEGLVHHAEANQGCPALLHSSVGQEDGRLVPPVLILASCRPLHGCHHWFEIGRPWPSFVHFVKVRPHPLIVAHLGRQRLAQRAVHLGAPVREHVHNLLDARKGYQKAVAVGPGRHACRADSSGLEQD